MRLLIAVVTGILFLGACSVPERPSSPPAPSALQTAGPSGRSKTPVSLERVSISYPAISGAPAALFVAKDQGIFASYGVEADITYIQGVNNLVAAIVSGEVPMSHVAAPQVIEGVLSGMDLVMVSGTIPVSLFTLYAQPEISTAEDLRGRTIGVDRVGSSSDVNVRTALRQLGIDPNREVSFMQVGGVPERLAALEQRVIDATVLIPPGTVLARKSGFRMVLDLAAQNIPYQSNAFVTSRQYLKDHEDTVRRTLRGLVEGIYFAKANREATIQVLQKYLQIEDREAVEEAYDFFVAKGYQLQPYPSIPGIQAIIEESATRRPEAAGARPEDFMDTRLVKELEESGFLRDLRRKYGL